MNRVRSLHYQRMMTVGGLALGFALCVSLFQHVQLSGEDFAALAGSMTSALALLSVFGVVVLSYLLMIAGARKWALLSHALHGEAGREPSRGFFLRHYLWQNWIGQFVPPSVAIIAGRGVAARAMPDVTARSGLWNGVLDQGLEFILLASLLGGSFMVFLNGGGWLALIGYGVAGVAAVFGAAWVGQRWLPAALRAVLWPVLGWSLARVLLTTLRLVIGVWAFSLSLSALSVVAATPVVGMLAVIPLTPANLGIAEWGWQGVLAFAGENSVQAALYPVGFRVLVLLAQTLLLGVNEVFVRFPRKLVN